MRRTTMSRRSLTLCLLAVAVHGSGLPSRGADPSAKGPADLILHHANIVPVDEKFRTFEAISVKDGRVLALGDDEGIFRLKGPKTRAIDADGRTVLPGLYDSHVHSVGAAVSELQEPVPNFDSLKDVFAHIRKKAQTTPEGDWI